MTLRMASGFFAVCCSFGCLADLAPQSAAQVCTVLNDTRLRAGEWTTHQDGQEGCSSGARSIKADAVDGNRISFAAEGAGGAPTKVRLTLNVMLPSDEDAAKRELIKATKRLSVRVLGLSIPHAFDTAIMKATPINLDVGSGHASLTRIVVNRQNYVLSVVME